MVLLKFLNIYNVYSKLTVIYIRLVGYSRGVQCAL